MIDKILFTAIRQPGIIEHNIVGWLSNDERNVKMFHDWIDKIVEIVNEFSVDPNDPN